MSSNCTSSKVPLVDYHAHPDFSIDAQGSIDEFCRAALAKGLAEICFTTHYDADPQYLADDGWVVVNGCRQRVTEPWLHTYHARIVEADRTYRPQGLAVKMGLEMGYFVGVEREVGRIMDEWPVDYLLGSVHWVDGCPISYHPHVQAWLAELGPSEALVRYYRALTAAAASGLFDCIAHLDLYRRTLGHLHEDELMDPLVRQVVDGFMAACVASGTGLEINTRDAEVNCAGTSPGPGLLTIAAQAGVDVVVTGSDSHGPEWVGRGICSGLEAARRAGFAQLTTYERRRHIRHPLNL